MSEIATIRVKDKRFEGLHPFTIINHSDFDPAIHTLIDEPEEPPAPPQQGIYQQAHLHQVGPLQPKSISGVERRPGSSKPYMYRGGR